MRALLKRAAITWLVMRPLLTPLLMEVARIAGDTPASGVTSVWTVMMMLLFVVALAELNVRRRHEHALFGNLGLSAAQRSLIALAPALVGELALAALVG